MTTATSAPHYDSSRRRSMALFHKSTFISSTTTKTGSAAHGVKTQQRPRPVSLFSGGSNSGSSIGLGFGTPSITLNHGAPPSPDLNGPLPPRPKILTRPSSVFIPLKSQEPSSPDTSTVSSSNASSVIEDRTELARSQAIVLFSGEVLSTGGLLRSLRRKEYLVLTETHLLRFRSHAKAAECFPVLSPGSRANGRSVSLGTVSDIAPDQTLIKLTHIVAVYEIDRTFVQVDHLDEATGTPMTTTMQLSSSGEADQWLRALCKTSRSANFSTPPFAPKTVEFIARRLEQERDYSPQNVMIFRVVHRLSGGKGQLKVSASSEDASKSSSTICYLAVGVHKIHLVQMPKLNNNRSAASLTSPAPLLSFGILTLCSLNMMPDTDDSFTLKFRSPCRQYQTLHLASSCCAQIIQTIRHAADFLRPEWVEPSFTLDIPEKLYNQPFPETDTPEDYLCFERTLSAYCSAYDVDASIITYKIEEDAEDGPRFTLLKPNHPRRLRYSVMELLAVLRSLRWNEAFVSISFRGVSLDPLKGLIDHHGSDMEPYRTRSGRKLNTKGLRKSLLLLELRAIAACSSTLRRMDFTDTLEKPVLRPSDDDDATDSLETGCEIVEAILPLCKKKLTSVDWIILSGVCLDQADLDWLVDAAVDKTCRLRGFEVARCDLSARSINLLLETLAAHKSTLEAIDISGNPGRLSTSNLNSLSDFLAAFPYLRILKLADVRLASANGSINSVETRSPMRSPLPRSMSLSLLSSSPSPSRSSSTSDIRRKPLPMRTVSGLSALSTVSSGRSSIREAAIISEDVLLNWKLVELDLSGTILNKQTVDALSTYLASQSSDRLTKLSLNRCGLKSGELAVLLGCLAREPGKPRNLHLHVDQLKITPDHNKLVDAIKKGLSPTHLTISNVDYPDEAMFRKLIRALSVNKTLRYLDLSRVFLPSDANNETIAALVELFSTNSTLEELDISGGYGRIEDGRLGQGLNRAIGTLAQNKTLKVLKVEQQRLGPQGAMVIAKMLETNRTLQKLHCANNGINLQGFTALVNAVDKNTSIILLPGLEKDRLEQQAKLKRDLQKNLNRPDPPSSSRLSVASHLSSTFHSLERRKSIRSLKGLASSVRSSEPETPPSLTEEQVKDALKVLSLRWDVESQRLQDSLQRNYQFQEERKLLQLPNLTL